MSIWRKNVRKKQMSLRKTGRDSKRLARLENLEDRRLLAVRVWDGGGLDDLWSTADNWVGDVAPLANDDLVFPDTAFQKTNTNDLAEGTLITTISFTGSGYDIDGNGLTLTGGIASQAAGDNSFAAGITMINPQTFGSANSGSTLTLGDVDTGSLFLLTLYGDGDVAVVGDISGSGGITKTGGGALILSGNNTYEGLTIVNEGVVRARSDNAFGAVTAPTTINSGAAIEIDGTLGDVHIGNEPLQVIGRGIEGVNDQFGNTGALRNLGGQNSWSGNIALSSTAVIGSDSGVLNLSGAVSSNSASARNLIKVGDGVLEFSGNLSNTYGGTTYVNQGTLRLSKTGGADAIDGNLIIGDHDGGPGSDVVELTNSDQIRHLDLTGTLNRTITINSTGALNLNGNDETVGAVIIDRSPNSAGSISTGAGTLTLEGNLTVNRTLPGTSGTTPAATISGNLDLGTVSRTFTINDTDLHEDAPVQADLEISANITGIADVDLIKAGAGYMSLSGNNTFQGNLFVAGGLGIGSDTALGQGLVSINAIVSAEGGDRSIANLISLDGTMTVIGTNNITFTGPANLTSNRAFRIVEAGQRTEFAGGIGEQLGSRGLSVAGDGTLVLSGHNTFTGGLTVGTNSLLGPTGSTRVNAPPLQNGNLEVSGMGSIVEVNSIAVVRGTLRVDNSTTNLSNRLGDASVTLSDGTIEYVSMAGTHSTELMGTISSSIGHNRVIVTPGAGGSVELNPNSLSLGNGGVVEFGSTGADLGSDEARIRFLTSPTQVTGFTVNRAFVVHSGGVDKATFDGEMGIIPFQDYVVDPAAITGLPTTSNVRLTSGNYTLTADTQIASLTLDGDNISIDTNGFELRITSGSVLNLGDGNSIDGLGTIATGGNSFNITVLDLADTMTVSAEISAGTTGGVTKNGAGTLVLSGVNNYAGNTEVGSGTLRITNDMALGSTSHGTNVRDGATLELDGVNVTGENFGIVVGTGVGGNGALQAVGASDSSWAGNVVLPSSGYTHVGADAGRTLDLSGVISGSSANFVKVGDGIVEFSGTSANTFTGTTFVNAGTLRLNKTAGVNALARALVVGDDLGGPGADVVEFMSSDQIANSTSASVTVNSSGLLDLNGNDETAGPVWMRIGVGQAGQIETGIGTFTLLSTLQVDTLAGADSTAQITGNLHLGAANRSFVVNDGAAMVDLDIDGVIMGSVNVTKTGAGTMQFSGSSANTYTGNTTISHGTLRLAKAPGNLAIAGGNVVVGDNIVAGNYGGFDALILSGGDEQIVDTANVTVQSSGLLSSMVTESINNLTVNAGFVMGTTGDLNVDGNLAMTGGVINTGTGALSVAGTITATGTVLPSKIEGNLALPAGSKTINVSNNTATPYDLQITADISGAGADIAKIGSGTLLLSGNNTFDGGVSLTSTTGVVPQLAIGSDTAFGTGLLDFTTTSNNRAFILQSVDGPRTIANDISITGTHTNNSLMLQGFNDLTMSSANGLEMTENRRFYVLNPAATLTMAGPISDDGDSHILTKLGRGTLVLEGDNTYTNRTILSTNGGIVVMKGTNDSTGALSVGEFTTLILTEDGTLLDIASASVATAGTIQIDNSTTNVADRLPDAANVTLTAAMFEMLANAAGSSETIGSLIIGSDLDSTVQLVSPFGSTNTLTAASLNLGDRESLAIRGSGAEIAAGGNELIFTAAPTLAVDIIARARIIDPSGLDFATATAGTPVTPGAFTTDINAGGNVKLVGDGGEVSVLAGDSDINALLLSNDVNITESVASTLAISSGYIAVQGGDSEIEVTNLNFGTVANANARGTIVLNSSLTIDAVIDTSNTESLAKNGFGNLILEGANTYQGRTRILQGGLIVRNDNALGTPGSGTNETIVTNRAFLLLDGARTIGDEFLNVSGSGFLGNQTGVLQATGGNSTWGNGTSTVFNRSGNTFIGVDAGSELVLAGEVAGTTRSMNKVGGGILEYSGTIANSYTGATTINDGTLVLNKDSGVAALQGTIVVGDGLGGDDSDQLIHASTGQIPALTGNRTFTINSSGRWSTNGDSVSLNNETSNRNLLLINNGATYSGDLDLGGGTLTLDRSFANGSLINNSINFGAATSQSVPATISNGTIVGLGTNQIITITDAGPAPDLAISALLSGDFRKDGTGSLGLLANNTLLTSLRLNGGTIIVGDDGALGTGTVNVTTTAAIIQGDDNTTPRTLSNNFELASNSTQTFTVGGVGGMAPLTFTGNFTSTGTGNRTFVLQNSTAEFQGDFDFNAAATVIFNTFGSLGVSAGNLTTIAGNLSNFTTLTKTGRGILQVQGTSDHTGVTSISQGIFRLQNAGALGASGATTNRTVVAANASLELDGMGGNLNIGDEWLQISSTTTFLNSTEEGFPEGFPDGFNAFIPGTQILRGIGSLRSVDGDNTWGTGTTELRWGANPSDIFVEAGTSLTLNTTVLGGTAASHTSGMVKLGEGTLSLAGTDANSYTGQTSVLEGTLSLDKPNGMNALGGTLLVGDGIGNDVVVWNADEQMPNVTIIAHQSGELQLNGFTESFSTLFLGVGETMSGSVTGGGQLNSNNLLYVPIDIRTTAATPAAVINANYDLGTANREFRVADGAGTEELVINGVISDTSGARGITKTRTGLVRFTGAGANTYDGNTTVNDGTIVVDKGPGVLGIPGRLIVGNGIGEQDTDRLISNFSDQIAPVSTTTINASGFLQLVDADNDLNLLTTVAGLVAGGHIDTGTGTLTVNTNNVTGGVVAGPVETSALIEGNLFDLGGANRTFNIAARQNTLDTRDEFQVINLGGATGGTFTLSFEGHTTIDIDFDATNAAVQTALRQLLTITNQNVAVQSPAPGIYYVFFQDALGKANVSELVIDGSGLTGGAPTVETRHDGIETVELTIDSQVTNSPIVTKTGRGALLLNNAANDFDNTTFTQGYLFLGVDSPVGTGTITINSSITEFRAFGADRELDSDISITSTGLVATGTNMLTFTGPISMTSNRTFFVSDPNTRAAINGVVSQSSGNRQLTKIGAGILELNAANTYTGDTNVNAGTLAGTGSVAATLRVDDVATAAPFTNPSNLMPGTSDPGIFTAGNTIFNENSIFTAVIGGPTAGNGPAFHNQLAVNGTVTLNAGSMFAAASFGGYVPVGGDAYVLIINDLADAITGEFGNVAEGQMLPNFLGSGIDAYATYQGNDGNDFVIAMEGDVVFTGTAAGEDFELRRETTGGVDLIQLLVGGILVDSRPTASVSSYTIDALAGNDTLLVNYDYNGGFFNFPITFNGGDDSDSMSVDGGTFTDVVFDYDSATGNPDAQSGTIDQDGTVITYTGLEPIAYAGDAVNMTFNLPGTDDQAVLEDDGILANDMLRLRSTTGQFEQTDFLAPTGSLTINLGADSAVFNVTSLTDLGAATAEINAGIGDDTVTVDVAVTHDVTINGEAGLDVLTGGSGNDDISGGDDNDMLNGGAGNDTLTAGMGDDTLDGGAGNDVLLGEDGLDTLMGGDNDDTLDGGADSDMLNGGLGVDDVDGGSGDDTIQVQGTEAEFDTMQGGTGYDVVTNIGAGPVTLNGFNPAFDVWTNGIEEYIGNGQTLQGNAGPNGLHLGFQILTNTPTVDGAAGDDSITTSHNNSNASPVAYDGGADIDHVTLVFTPDQLGEFTTAEILIIQDYLLDPTGKTLNVSSDPAKGNFTATNFESASLAVYDDDVILDITDCILQIISEDQIIVGTMGDDTITGTHLGDLIFGQDGNDVIDGVQGNDCIFGGADDDTISGSDGDDLLVGGSGNDDISGSLGKDRLLGGSGNDNLQGEQHNDELYGGSGDDTLDGGVNIDYLDGGDGNDLLIGGKDIDTLLGGFGDDTLDGGASSDLLNGGPGIDQVFGGDYSDTIQISGNEAEFDLMDAGPGTDILEIIGGGPAILNGLGPASSFGSIRGNDQGIFGNGNANTFDLTGIYPYHLAFVNALGGNDILVGTPYNDVLIGGQGNDNITGGNGNDSIFGDDGDDTIDAGQGADTIRGGTGADIIDGGTGNDTFQVAGNDSIADTLNAGSGTDWIQNVGASDVIFENFDSTVSLFEKWDNAGFNVIGTAAANSFNFSKLFFTNTPEIRGLAGDDTITGSNGADRIFGDAGNDMLFGLGGADELYGGDDDDTLDGGATSDLISGGAGNNQLTGSFSQDTFVVSDDPATVDVITDYSYDRIDLSAFGITYADLVFTQNGADLDISIIGFTKQIKLLNRNTIPNAGYFIF